MIAKLRYTVRQRLCDGNTIVAEPPVGLGYIDQSGRILLRIARVTAPGDGEMILTLEEIGKG